MTKQKRKNDHDSVSSVNHIVMLLFFAATTSFFAFMCFGIGSIFSNFNPNISSCFMSPCLPEWDDMGSVADYYNLNIPRNTENIHYENDGQFFTFMFNIAPEDLDIVKDNSCTSEFYEGYDPTQKRHSFSSEHPTVLIKTHDYIFYSHSIDTPQTVIGKLCPWNMAIKIDISSSDRYYVTYERYDYDSTQCDIECYTTQRFIQPIEDSTFSVLGLTKGNDENFYLEFDELCFDSKMYRIVTPPNHYIASGTQINIRIDDMSIFPTGFVNQQTRLVKEFEVISEEHRQYKSSAYNEFCVKQGWSVGKHTVDVEMILPDKTIEHYSFDFYVE